VEKRKPSFSLDAFKSVCGDPKRLAITRTAAQSAEAIGFGRLEIAQVIRSIQRHHFCKSMTSLSDHRRWQDVYHVPWEGMVLYVKFTGDVLLEFVVLSFKER
jgi:motility quorum-sensing regulator/GCU-specific mRNA interferase toxin